MWAHHLLWVVMAIVIMMASMLFHGMEDLEHERIMAGILCELPMAALGEINIGENKL